MKADGSRLTCALAIGLLFMPLVHAEGEASNDNPMGDCNTGAKDMEVPRPGWLLTWENDSLIGFANTDEGYTQGLRFGYRVKPDRQKFLSHVMSALCRSVAGPETNGAKLVGAGSFFLGQHLFTPGDITNPTLIEDDRPYAGWLYLGTRLEVAEKFDTPGHLFQGGIFHSFEFQVGILGPQAQGFWVQNGWHKISPAPQPKGWDNQLKNEGGVQFRYTARGLVTDLPREKGAWNGWQLQGTLDGDFNLGTILDSLGVGTTWRFGRNLGDPVALDLGPTQKASDPCIKLLGVQECYLFVGLTGHAIGFSAVLDGGFFRDGHSVDKDDFVHDYVAGIRLGGKRFQLDFTETLRSREFSPVPPTSQSKSGSHTIGAINLRCFAPIDHDTRHWHLICPGLFAALVGAVAIKN